jgi:large subunit ribosomal protein L32e
MATEVKRLIRVRVDKGAKFKRDGYGKKRQLSDSWRKPRGQHNKQREQKKAKGALPKPGYGSPVAVRNMHPSGFFEVLVTSAKDLIGLDPKTQAVRIGGTVGDRKRVALQDAAIAAGLKVLNARSVKAKATKAPAKAKAEAKDAASRKKAEKKPSASKAAPKKEAKKEKPVPRTEEKKEKAPAKKAAAKPKAEAAAEKPAKKEKAPAKAAKAPAKPREEKAGDAKPKAAAKTASATKAKKTTKSEVKKND